MLENSSEAGTTRDIVSVSFHHKGKKILIQDTAGLRRPGKITKETIESFSVIRTEQALKNSDIAVLVIDAVEGLVALDANILGEAKEWGKGIVLAVNKIDEIKEDKDEYIAKTIWQLQSKLNFAPWLPVVFISAQNEENINSLLNQVVAAFESRNTVIDEKTLNEITEHLRNKNSQLAGLTRMTQKSVNPPTFELKFKGNRVPHKTQIRYIENIIRDVFPMSGTPIFLDLAIKKDERTKIRK
ncbi:MAG: GTP-binding protein [Candidatus Berkelbacteria bacterium]|nr:GTP-binding protein [Candidatus Berkelbacteria bacterium]